jgi:hypothetical protein
MKIIGIFAEKSAKGRLALITRPPMTEDVLNALTQVAGVQVDRFELSIDSEALMVKPPLMPHNVQALEGFLSEAEKLVAANHQAEEQSRQDYLEAVSKQSGLPLK